MMNWKGSGREQPWFDPGNNWAFVSNDRGKLKEVTLKITGFQVQIRTEYLPNTSLHRYYYANPLGNTIFIF
jgi:hypothetical protein